MRSAFDLIDDEALIAYLNLIASIKQVDVVKLATLADTAVRYYRGNGDIRYRMSEQQALERRWYASLMAGTPDYSVYDDEYFTVEVWACWIVYSRKYLRSMRKASAIFDNVQSIADLGCGCGLTTAALKEIFPEADVIGTNVDGSVQYRVAQKVGERRNFTIRPQVESHADLIFASEYFEHFERPIEHLSSVLKVATPQYLVIANAFGATSVGHFDTYYDGSTAISGAEMGRAFNDRLRSEGYSRVKTGFWNNRPDVWKKGNDEPTLFDGDR